MFRFVMTKLTLNRHQEGGTNKGINARIATLNASPRPRNLVRLVQDYSRHQEASLIKKEHNTIFVQWNFMRISLKQEREGELYKL